MWRDLVFALRSFRKAPAFNAVAVLSLALVDAFEGVFGRFATTINFSTGDESQGLLGELVTGQYFQTMQVKPGTGRLLTDEDVNDAAANPVCVLSYEFWRREFAGDPQAVGRTVFLKGHAYRVLGVTAKGFVGADMQHRFDLQVPAKPNCGAHSVSTYSKRSE